MQLQTVLCYTYDMIFITIFLKSKINYVYNLRVSTPSVKNSVRAPAGTSLKIPLL
jgi:hypothetical protein